MDLRICPHCNLHSHVRYSHTAIQLCSNCNRPITNDSIQLFVEDQFKMALKPSEMSFDLMHRSFWYNAVTYKITGYIRYYYTEGYLYMWAAYNHSKHIWLCECLGNWFVLSEENEPLETDPIGLRPNDTFSYKGIQYHVDAVSFFYNYYMEGELPAFPYMHLKGISIECSNQDNLIQFNVFQESLIKMYVGKVVHLEDLKISNT